MKKPWHLYMVRCSSGALYTGITTDIADRVAKHNAGVGAKSVIALGLPVRLVYHKKVGSYSDALKEERRVKALPKEDKEKMVPKVGVVEDKIEFVGAWVDL